MKSPTQRSLKYLRDEGWIAAIVEKWNPHAKIRQDLFGFADIIAFDGLEVLLVQCTTSDNMAKRIKKIKEIPLSEVWTSGNRRRIQVHGWSKKGARGKRKTWQIRIEEIL